MQNVQEENNTLLPVYFTMTLIGILVIAKLAKRVLIVKKLIMDCQLSADQIQPFIVNGQMHPAIHNLPMISEQNVDTIMGERAVIIGGSISGLLTASCLSPFFKEVVIVERTKFNEGESVVKNRHGYLPHILVNRGQVILEKIFPGIIQTIRKKSIDGLDPSSSSNDVNGEDTELFVMKNYINSTRDLKIVYGTGQEYSRALTKASSEENSIEDVTIVSRGMWETSIREFILKGMKNLRVMDGYQVLSNGNGITYSIERELMDIVDIKVNGVIVQPSLENSNREELIPCDLLVNCGSYQTSTEYSKLLRGLELALIDPFQKQESIPTTHHHLLSSSKINNKVRYHCFYFEPRQEAFNYYNKQSGGDSFPFVLKDGKKRIIQSPLTVARSSYDSSSCDDLKNEFMAFYYLLIYPFTKGVLCIPLEKNQFMINLITIADEERENNRVFCDGLTPENAKERIINMYAKGTPFEKDLTYVLSRMKDKPLSIPPVFEKEGSIYVHYEKFLSRHHVTGAIKSESGVTTDLPNHFSNNYQNTLSNKERSKECKTTTKSQLSGFISLGDSVSSLNPVYAQGMTIVLESVLILREQLKEKYHSLKQFKSNKVFDNEFCHKFQNSLYYMYTIPWLMSTSDDIRYTDKQLVAHSSLNHTLRNQRGYSKLFKWQKILIAPLLHFVMNNVFERGQETAPVASYFFSILNMHDGYRYALINLYMLLYHVLRRHVIRISFLILLFTMLFVVVTKIYCNIF